MKTTAKILFLLLLVGSIATGCKKLLDVEFDADFKATMDVYVPATSLKADTYPFSDTYTIDPATNSDYHKYADKIVDVNLTGISGTITSVNPTGVHLLAGTVVEVSKAGFATVRIFTTQSIPIAVGTTVTYNDTDGSFDALDAIFKDQNPITITYSGATDQPGVTFTYELVFATTVTANPL
jgi:hypothetical protein